MPAASNLFAHPDGQGTVQAATRLVAPVVPLQVAHFLLCPQLHHLTGITPTVACLETEIAHHVPLAVLEHKDGGFVNLDGQLFTIRAYSMVHVCLTRTRVASGVP